MPEISHKKEKDFLPREGVSSSAQRGTLSFSSSCVAEEMLPMPWKEEDVQASAVTRMKLLPTSQRRRRSHPSEGREEEF